ncbi:MAG: hypothetical protein OHK93_000323 [Ramalina farinacea]|uniref:Carbohydrate-binding module family 19 domain-containing protein n=1 Tax=Ramalina farinacea TaxID=258253 RepID=A0AA43QEN5_9LECA|nr:hypothetical protein [Ramalina farinacea]
MRSYYIILLAVCFNVIQAGPLPGKDGQRPYECPQMPFMKTPKTDTASRRHLMPRYTNGTFVPPSVTQESVQPESTSPTSTALIPSSNELSSSITPTATPSTAEDKSAAFEGGEDQKGAGQSSSGVAIAPEGSVAGKGDLNTASAAAAQPVSSTAASTTALLAPFMSTPSPSYPGGSASDLASADAFEAFQSGRAAQASANPGTSSSGYQAQLVSASQPQTATPSLTSEGQQDQVPSSTGATATTAGQSSAATGSSISSMPSAEEVQAASTTAISSTSNYGVVTTSASQVTNQLSASSDITSTSLPEITLARTTAETTSPIVQVPSTLLGTVNPSTSTTGSSLNGQPSSSAKAQYAYPDASAGNVAMAQGYNSIFQGLTPESPCDPSNSQQASACVDGQPGKCELTGTYALQSCKSGFSCFAVPLPGGQSGVNIGCYDPDVAHHALQNDGTDTSSASNSGQTSAGATTTFLTGNPTSTNAIMPEVASSPAISTPLAVAAAAATTGAAAIPSSVTNGKAEVTSAAPSTPTSTSGKAHFAQGMQSQNRVQAAPSQANQPQPTSSLESSPASSPDANSGVQLSFPDQPGIGSTVGSNNAKQNPPSNQKNAVQDDRQNVSPSPAVPSSPTAVTATSTAGITAAPAIGAGDAKGFITVTVTQTTTMHD